MHVSLITRLSRSQLLGTSVYNFLTSGPGRVGLGWDGMCVTHPFSSCCVGRKAGGQQLIFVHA